MTNDVSDEIHPFMVYRIDGNQMECALWQFRDGKKALALFLSGDAATSYRAAANLGDEWKVFSQEQRVGQGNMAKRKVTGNRYDPRHGGQAIRTHSLRLDTKPSDPARTNCFAIYFIESGSGTSWADASCFDFGPDSLLFFVPYQRIRFVPTGPVCGEIIEFHANFLCVESLRLPIRAEDFLASRSRRNTGPDCRSRMTVRKIVASQHYL